MQMQWCIIDLLDYLDCLESVIGHTQHWMDTIKPMVNTSTRAHSALNQEMPPVSVVTIIVRIVKPCHFCGLLCVYSPYL